MKTQKKRKKEADPWLEILENIDQYAVETEIEDLAENHDHYLYGTPTIMKPVFVDTSALIAMGDKMEDVL